MLAARRKRLALQGKYILITLLIIIIAVELSVDIIKGFQADVSDSIKKKYRPIYHAYIPVEYLLICLFFLCSVKSRKLKRFIIFSVVAFGITCAFISLSDPAKLDEYPSYQFNISGALLLILAILVLLDMSSFNTDTYIYHYPLFWICAGVLLFHAGIFYFVGVYKYLSTHNKELASDLNAIIIGSFNIIYYSFWLFGITWKWRTYIGHL